MNKICTLIKQSRKLIELGIDTDTADMVYCIELYKEGWKYSNEAYPIDGTLEGDDIPAWSLSALLKLLPSEFEETGSFGTFKYKIDIRKYKSTDEMDVYQIAYGNYLIGNSGWKDMINTGWKEDPIDAAFDMVCWLLENKKI